MAAAALTEPRCASERGLAMGGGRPAERRFTQGVGVKSVGRCHRTVLAYWKFESTPLQRRVCEPSVPLGFRDPDILDLMRRRIESCPALVNVKIDKGSAREGKSSAGTVDRLLVMNPSWLHHPNA
jgi:hypothetical protein